MHDAVPHPGDGAPRNVLPLDSFKRVGELRLGRLDPPQRIVHTLHGWLRGGRLAGERPGLVRREQRAEDADR